MIETTFSAECGERPGIDEVDIPYEEGGEGRRYMLDGNVEDVMFMEAMKDVRVLKQQGQVDMRWNSRKGNIELSKKYKGMHEDEVVRPGGCHNE